MAKSKNSSSRWDTDLYAFFSGDLAERAGSYLSERAVIAIHVEDRHFLFRRQKGGNTVTESDGPADVHFFVPLNSLRHLLSLAANPDNGIGALGVAVIELLFESDTERKITVRVESSFLGLWSKGFFSVLKAGGPEVASYLARWGFDSIAKVKEILKKIGG